MRGNRVGGAEGWAPCRADLAGGTLDIWPLGLLHAGALTVNVAVPVLVRVRVTAGAPEGEVIHRVPGDAPERLTVQDARRNLTAAVVFGLRPSGGVEVEAVEQPPVGSGLGGSSAYAAALAHALARLRGNAPEPAATVAWLRDVEAVVLGTPTGTQDHWAAVKGGVLAIHHEPGAERVERLAVDEAWLNDRMSVFFTGLTHRSGVVNWRVVQRRLDGEPGVCGLFDDIVGAAQRCRDGLTAGNGPTVAAAVSAEWRARRLLSPEVSPPELDELVECALHSGAMAVKGCGAAGGGSLVVWHEPDARQTILSALTAAAPGGRLIAVGARYRGWGSA